ncbi:hypothetical protein QWY99_05125 [Flavobacterium branchiarum]|uniref:Phage abortive infection protein n=1 Tax=Flavobacterium branchiarum TaxID=1114870 RepID=A0ABV5FJZ9_9FLAO|nr:hypothetical protein [Flavobacterium branchiarum]MDN3672438.1 hypothetical protein [Flavobacterium branchiarum]
MIDFLKKNKNFRNALFVFIIAFSSFLAFEPLFENLGQKASQEFAAAIFGTIFAAVITMVLLSKQSETEQERSRNEKVFEQKIVLFNQVLDYLQTIYENLDDANKIKISRAKITQIEFLLAKMVMIGNDKTIKEFKSLYQNITNNYVPETQILTLNISHKHTIFRFADYCREELGLSDKNLEKEILEDIVLQGELFYNLEQKEPLDFEIQETIKDIYGFLAFDLNVPIENIKFLPNGFEAYINKTQDKKRRFIECLIDNQEIYVNIPVSDMIKDFQLNGNTFKIKPSDRNKFIAQQVTIEKAIEESYEFVKKQKIE